MGRGSGDPCDVISECSSCLEFTTEDTRNLWKRKLPFTEPCALDSELEPPHGVTRDGHKVYTESRHFRFCGPNTLTLTLEGPKQLQIINA